MTPDFSVIVPFFNEEDSVGPLCDTVTEALKDEKQTYELILVDDGSSDDTFERAKRCVKYRRS